MLSLFCGGSRNLWRLSATLASATLSVPPSRRRQGFKPNLPRYIAAAAKQDCTSKSDNQSPISGTGECGHITHGHSTPTLAQKLVGGVTWPCSILPTYSIGCAVRRATCTHAPLRPVSLDPAFAHSIGTKPRLILFPKAEALAVTPHKGGREVAAATAHSGSLRNCGFHGLLTRHGSTSKSRSAVGAGHSPMWRNLRLHGVPVEGSRFVSVPAQR